MAGIQIQSLPTASTLTGSELAVVSQNNVTKKTTIDDINAAPLEAASDALIAANDAASDAATALSTANTAQSTANTAQSAANTAQSTANGKLSTVSVDGTTITGNGTSGNPLVATTSLNYTEYRGYLTISGTNVTFTSMKNDVGAISWVVASNGELQGTLTNAFPVAKFWGISGSMNGGNVPYITITKRLFDSIIGVDIFKYDGTRTGTPNGSFFIHLIINN